MSRDPGLFIEDIAAACDRISRYCKGISFEQFRHDEKTFDAVVRNLEIIGEAAKRMSEEMRSRHCRGHVVGIAGVAGDRSAT